MIAADRLNLHATVVQGISQNLSLLVNLYSQNLNSLGVQAAFVASLAYASVTSSSYNDDFGNTERPYLSGLFYSSNAYCLITALLCVIISSLSTVYGPWLALTGEDNAMTIKAVLEMKKAQSYVFYIGASSVFVYCTTFIFYSFTTYNKGTAGMVSLVVMSIAICLGKMAHNSMKQLTLKGQKHLDEIFKMMQGDKDNEKIFGENPSSARFPTNTFADYVWRREEAHHGGNFNLVFANLRRGAIEIYKDKKSFDDGDNTLEQIKLLDLMLSLDVGKFHHETPSFAGLSFKFSRKFTLDHSLLFAVVPREDHEVVASVAQVEFQAISKASKENWVSALRAVDDFHSKTRKNAAAAILSGQRK